MKGFVHVVDDDASFRTAMERRLKQAGYEVGQPGRPRVSVFVQFVWSARAVREGLRELSAGSYRWRESSGFRAPWAVRQQQAAQPRQQSLVVQAELGFSKAWGPWTFEIAPSVTFFSDNTDFFGGNRFAQAPIYAVQAHLLYTFQSVSGWPWTGSILRAAMPP